MNHPVIEVAGAVVVVVAVGVGTMLVLPPAKPEPPAQTIVLEFERSAAVRVEPEAVKSDAERVDDLQRQLGDIAAEQKRLASDLRTAVRAHSTRKDRKRRAR